MEKMQVFRPYAHLDTDREYAVYDSDGDELGEPVGTFDDAKNELKHVFKDSPTAVILIREIGSWNRYVGAGLTVKVQ